MKKFLFLIFLFSVFLFLPRGANATVIYEATVWVTSIKVPERGEQMPPYYGYGFADAEFRIDRQPDITVKDSAGNVVKRVNFSEDYLQYGISKNFTFRHEGVGKYSIYIHFTAPSYSYTCSANCTIKGAGYCLYLKYLSQSGWANASCPNCGIGGDSAARFYTGTSPDVWFCVAKIDPGGNVTSCTQ